MRFLMRSLMSSLMRSPMKFYVRSALSYSVRCLGWKCKQSLVDRASREHFDTRAASRRISIAGLVLPD